MILHSFNEADVVIDFGYKKVLVEIKKSKTLKQGHWKVLSKIANFLKINEIYLISNYPEEIQLDNNTKHILWWHMKNIFQ